MQPSSGSVHVPTTDRKIRKEGTDSVEQDLVEGMNFELSQGVEDAEEAMELAAQNLALDPEYYKAGDGLCLDLGSGKSRVPGFVGIDLYPHDDYTLVHDLDLGLPFGDESVSCVRLVGYDGEIGNLLEEIHRVLKPGGCFIYDGDVNFTPPDDMQVILQDELAVKKSTMKFYQKNDPATADDAEPMDQKTIDRLQYQAHGAYLGPVDINEIKKSYGEHFSKMVDVAKGGPGSGRKGGGKTSNPAEEGEAAARAENPVNHTYYKAPKNPAAEGEAAARADSQRSKEKKPKEHDETGAHGGSSGFDPYAAAAATANKSASKIIKADAYKQIVYGVVLAPNEVDAQDEWMSPEDIERTAHLYMQKSRVVGGQHTKVVSAVPVESYIAPVDMEFDGGQYGKQTVTKGSWVLAVKILDPKEWENILAGEYQSFSIGGFGLRTDD